jgi:perosamine synthetase
MHDYQRIVDFIRDLYKCPKDHIPLHAPVFCGNEKKYLSECIDSTFVSSVGRFVEQFENGIADFTGVKKAVACVNGTSALHIALKLMDVKYGNEVITQPLTFVATANAIAYCGATPIFLDVDIDTMGLSPVKLERWLKENVTFKKSGKTGTMEPFNKITGRKISACIPMHTFGHPCRIDEIVDICNNFKIPVIEDAAESVGSFYKRQHTGTFGKIGVLSFNGNKILTTGGGGMLLFNDGNLAEKARHMTTQAKLPHRWEFSHDEIGYNYRMPNINAALGLAQLEQLSDFLISKRDIAAKYKYFFKVLRINYISEPADASSNYWLNCILFGSREMRDYFLTFSNELGVQTRPAWQLINKLTMFSECQTDELINANYIADRLVNIPSSVINNIPK